MGRLEGFIDGVFTFAITLLVLYLKDPGLTRGAFFNGWPQWLVADHIPLSDSSAAAKGHGADPRYSKIWVL